GSSTVGPRDAGRRTPTRLPGSPTRQSTAWSADGFRREREAELVRDRDGNESLLERRAHGLRREQHEPAELVAAADDRDLDAAGRQQEVGVRGDELGAF